MLSCALSYTWLRIVNKHMGKHQSSLKTMREHYTLIKLEVSGN